MFTKKELQKFNFCVCSVEWVDAFYKDHASLESITSEQPVYQHTIGVLITERDDFAIILHELTTLNPEHYVHYTAVPYSIIKNVKVHSEPIKSIEEIIKERM